MRALVVLALLSSTAASAAEQEPEPLVLGRLIGAKSQLTLRTGLWIGGLSPGLFSTMAASDVVQPEGAAIGRGSGLVTELGLRARLGDFDLAFSFLTDELIDSATDDVDDLIARTVLRQLIGQLRSRVFDTLVGTEVALGVRTGAFSGPIDASKFGFRDNEVWFGKTEDSWETDYLSLQLGAAIDTFVSDYVYLRYSRFSTPQVLEIIGTDPVGIQTAVVDAFGLGFQVVGETPRFLERFAIGFDLSMVPLTGVASFDYGPWGELWGVLFELESAVTMNARFQIDQWVALEPYVGFRADMLSPIGGSFSPPGDLPSFLVPDFLLWGPIFGLEVSL